MPQLNARRKYELCEIKSKKLSVPKHLRHASEAGSRGTSTDPSVSFFKYHGCLFFRVKSQVNYLWWFFPESSKGSSCSKPGVRLSILKLPRLCLPGPTQARVIKRVNDAHNSPLISWELGSVLRLSYVPRYSGAIQRLTDVKQSTSKSASTQHQAIGGISSQISLRLLHSSQMGSYLMSKEVAAKLSTFYRGRDKMQPRRETAKM